jgi:uncharacterized protein (TIGR02466 family)
MINTFAWKIKSNVVEYTNVLQIKNAVTLEQRQHLVQEILENKTITQDVSGSEKNCWRGHPTFKDNLVNELILTAFDKYIDSLPDSALLTRNEHPDRRFDLHTPVIHHWANVNSKHGYNIAHTHVGSVVSGVIYLQAAQTGMIEFHSSNYIYKTNHPCWFYNGSMQYHPEDGDILLFPSHLLHSVEPNPADKERINIAFNISYKPK